MIRLLLNAALVLAVVACSPSETAPTETPDEAMEPPVPVSTPIDVTGEACGGITGVMCPAGFYCEKPQGQCLETLDGVGTCQPRPTVCAEGAAPVCGCDGRTYETPCAAAQAGVSIVAGGECGGTDTF
jgi:hypothetical protein